MNHNSATLIPIETSVAKSGSIPPIYRRALEHMKETQRQNKEDGK